MNRLFLLSGVVAGIILFSGCAIFDVNNNYLHPEDFAKQLQKDGIRVDALRALDPSPLAATAAVELKIGQSNVGVYKFDTNIEVQRKRLERIRKNKRIYFNGIPYPIYEVSGSFIVVGLDKHQDKARILKSLRNFR
jgi:hypothetical protein